MVLASEVQSLIAGWWFEYDQGNFSVWPRYFTREARFCCRSDSGATEFEDFIRADVSGRDQVIAWQTDHRVNSPYPLRHNGTNVHLTSASNDRGEFRSYLLCTQIVGGSVSPLASGLCLGTVKEEDGELRFAELRVILDFTDSVVFGSAVRYELT
jgi:hypothetical protein